MLKNDINLVNKIQETDGLVLSNNKIDIYFEYKDKNKKALKKKLNLELTNKNIKTAKQELKLLKAINENKGITIHGKRIRLSFVYKGQRCIENLNYDLTIANIKAAANKRTAIVHSISTGSFDYAKEFPNSKKAHLFSDTPCANQTVEEAARSWLEVKKTEVTPSTYKSYHSKFNHHIIPKFGKRRLDSIVQSDIKKWIAKDLYHLANKTINNIVVPFKGVFDDAVADRKLAETPFKTIKPLKENKPKPDPFVQDELVAIVHTPTIKVQEINAFEFACWTGLRPSEMIMVAWEDIDTINWQLKVKRAKVDSTIKKTKTDGSERTIDLLEPAIEVLKRQMSFSQLLPSQEIKVLDTDKKSIFTENIRFVFLNSISSEPFPDTSYFRRHFLKPHLAKAGVRDRGVKQARHTFASQLLTLGEDIKWIAEQMGHTTVRMVEQHYGKWMKRERPNKAKDISKKLNYLSKRSNGDPRAIEKVINSL